MKFVGIVFISIVVTVSLGTVIKNAQNKSNSRLVSPLVAGVSDTIPSANITLADTISNRNWQTFSNNYFGYQIKHPSSVHIVNKSGGDIVLQKDKTIDITITQEFLISKETINTAIEKIIDRKKKTMGENFTMVNPISPIAIGEATAQSYSTLENKDNYSYYFIPQKNNKYLLITNHTTNIGSADYLLSEDIIYSISLTQ